MATRTKKVNQWYIKYATQNLVLSMDDNKLYCEVISENVEGVSYQVEMNEETMVAISCNCPACTRCKHMDIADSLSYKVEEAPVVEETTHNHSQGNAVYSGCATIFDRRVEEKG